MTRLTSLVVASLLIVICVLAAALSLSAEEKRRFGRYGDHHMLGGHDGWVDVIKDDLDGRCWAVLSTPVDRNGDAGARTAFGPVPCGDAPSTTK